MRRCALQACSIWRETSSESTAVRRSALRMSWAGFFFLFLTSVHVSLYYTAVFVSLYCYLCVLMLLYVCPHTAMYVSSCCHWALRVCWTGDFSSVYSLCICMCPHTGIYLCMCPLYMCPHTPIYAHTTIYVSSYCYLSVCVLCMCTLICVFILLNVCPHTATEVSSCCCMCVLILLCMCPHTAAQVLQAAYVYIHMYVYIHTTCRR